MRWSSYLLVSRSPISADIGTVAARLWIVWNLCSLILSSRGEENVDDLRSSGQDDVHSRSSPSAGLSIYRKVLRVKRLEQRQAVLRLSEIKDAKKQSKMLDPVVRKLIEVLEDSRINVPQEVGPSDFDNLSQSDKTAASLILENTLFFGDIVLRMPDTTSKLIKSVKGTRETVQWAVGFSNATGFLDSGDLTTLDLMSQELNLASRREDYVNIYTNEYKIQEERAQQLARQQAVKQDEKVQKKNKTRPLMSGPRAEL